VGTRETRPLTAPRLLPHRDTDIYDDVEIYGRCRGHCCHGPFARRRVLLPGTGRRQRSPCQHHGLPSCFPSLPSLPALSVIPLPHSGTSLPFSQFPTSSSCSSVPNSDFSAPSPFSACSIPLLLAPGTLRGPLRCP